MSIKDIFSKLFSKKKDKEPKKEVPKANWFTFLRSF